MSRSRRDMPTMMRQHAQLASDIFRCMQQPRSPKQEKSYRRAVNHQCSYCGAVDTGSLRACSLCRSVRYCNRDCQTADYKSRHKEECSEFVHPPFTTAFLTEPVGDAKYARDPVFAKGSLNGVGCWVSVKGGSYARLQNLHNGLPPKSLEENMEREKMAALYPEVAGQHRIYTSCLLTLNILVQNRRKDKAPAMVFGALAHILSFAHSFEDCMKGEIPGVDKINSIVDERGEKHAILTVVDDVWDKKPRLFISHIDGINVSNQPNRPEIIDAARGIVKLDPGQFVVMQLQYRIGDGTDIRRDWSALACMQSLILPIFAPWDDKRPPDVYDRALTEYLKGKIEHLLGIRCDLKADPLEDYYGDLIYHGDRKFVESHYGKEHADALERKHNEVFEHEEEMARTFRMMGGGTLDAFVEHCKRSGLGKNMPESLKAALGREF
ncbi:hypothetical protein OH76DRAFT_1395171 [Lentinus brumalis]|uniref:MYND-type domain-containing protein n=1 Tax=Lentinus brumalis TaxID=2498619 RepID=A0A371DXV1_9APHY|nr:hypothetical protein OH76DRAFT_1395171 [Polyporus brumalis]